jgi:hypothetical protein
MTGVSHWHLAWGAFCDWQVLIGVVTSMQDMGSKPAVVIVT